MATNDVLSEDEVLSAQTETSNLAEKSASEAADAKAKKKREKVRSAWISFVGRIVAQLVGAVATIALGLMVVQHYGVGSVRSDAADTRVDGDVQTRIDPARRVARTSAASARVGGSGGAKPPGEGLTGVARTSIASEPRERSGDHGVPASERVGGSGGAKPPGEETRPVDDGRPTVVVLPFANFSTDASLEPFVDGLTELLVAELTRVASVASERVVGAGPPPPRSGFGEVSPEPAGNTQRAKADGAKLPGEGITRAGSLRVISRTSSMHYKGSRKPLREIARELDVDLVVEGSVAQFKGRVRVVAQLIDALTDDHVWAQSYERGLGDVLELQASVARVIAQEVKLAAAHHSTSRSEGSPKHATVAFSARPLAGR